MKKYHMGKEKKSKNNAGKMTAGAGSGVGRLEKAGMSVNGAKRKKKGNPY